MKLTIKALLLFHFITLFTIITARPQPQEEDQNDADSQALSPDNDEPISNDQNDENDPEIASEVAKDVALEQELEEMMEEDEDEDYYEDYGWSDTIMNPMRNVGQSISNGVGAVAGMANNAASSLNEWWADDDDDYEYMEAYNDMDEQVNAWWDAHINEEYNYDEDDDDDDLNNEEEYQKDENSNSEAQIGDNMDDDDDYDEDYEDDLYDYYDLYSQMRYPKPEAVEIQPKSIHKNTENKVQLQRMKSRVDVPYGADDYFDFVVIAMCVVLLFIMLLTGVSRYQNQRYLRAKYGRKSEEKTALLRD